MTDDTPLISDGPIDRRTDAEPRIPLSRRTVLGLLGATGISGCADTGEDGDTDDDVDEDDGTGADDDEGEEEEEEEDEEEEDGEEGEPTEFVFEGWTSGWIGVSPEEIEGITNPTIELEVDQPYEFTWENMDGIPHNIELLDENLEVVDDYETDIISEKGATQTLEATATEEMAVYRCVVHPESMIGDLDLGVERDDDVEEELPQHDVLVPPEDLAEEPEHDVDLRDLLLVIERDNESVTMVDTTRHETLTRIDDVGHAIHVADYHPDLPENTREGAFVYTQSREGWMYKIDLFAFERVARVRAGVDARDIAVTGDARYVAGGYYEPRQLFIADADDMSPIETIETSGEVDGEAVPSQVHALYDVPEEGLLLVALFEAGRVQLFDYTEEGFPMVADLDVAGGLHDGFFTADGRYFFIASQREDVMGVIDTQERELVTRIPTGDVPHPGPGAVDPERNLAFTTHLGSPTVTVWDTDDFEVVKNIEVPGKGLFIQKHPDSEFVWADVLFDSEETDSLVYQIDPDTLEVGEIVDTSQWGEGRSLHPEFTRDGSEVYFSLWDAGKLIVLDESTGELVAELDGFETPTGKFLGARAEEHASPVTPR